MRTFILLLIIWGLTFMLVPDPSGALVLTVLATGMLASMGRRINAKSGLMALAAILFGVYLDREEQSYIAMPVVGAALVLALLWTIIQGKGATPSSSKPGTGQGSAG